jgi:hypothetical protein
MTAIALPVVLLLGLLFELVSGLVAWPLGGEKAWWRAVSGIGPDVARLVRDRERKQQVTVVEAGGAAAALLGSGLVAAGALNLGPGGLVLLYLALALAFSGTSVVAWARVGGRRRLSVVLAEVALAVGLGTMFLRYGALDLDAVRGTQQILGTGLLLGPVMTVVGLVAGAKAVAWSVALNLPRRRTAADDEQAAEAGPAILLRLCRWSLAGAVSVLAGVLLAGGALDPLEDLLPCAAASGGFAVALGIADGILARLADRWRDAVAVGAFLLAGVGAALVVLS